MKKLVQIALRNIIKNKKRSFYIGLAIFISCFILLMSNSIGNGTAQAIINEYYFQQAGDVVLIWEKAVEIDQQSPSRIYLSMFEAEKAKENKEALKRLQTFLTGHEAEIADSFKVVRRPVVLATEEVMVNVNVYGVSKAEWELLQRKKLVELEQGAFDAQAESSVMISRFIAENNDLKVGDELSLESVSAYGANNAVDFIVGAIYKNGIPWNNDYIYLSDRDARLLYDFDPEDFDSMRIYLKDPANGAAFARELDAYLLEGSAVLRALPGPEASLFFTQQADFFKSLYTFFVVFLIVIIGFGIRATVRMNLFERMSEFGTLRAIGFNRRQNFFIIFCEIFLLAFFSLFLALLCSTALILVFSHTGIYIGSGPVSYLFGGDYLHPIFRADDALFALAVIFILALIAPFKPAMQLCYQKITDILLKRQQRIPLTLLVLRNTFFRKSLR